MWMTLLVLGVGFFVPFVAIKTALAQLVLRFERDDAFWVALAGHCANIAVGAPLFALVWWGLQNLARGSFTDSPSVLVVALFYASIVIPFDVWTSQGIIRNGSYPDLDDGHPSSTLVQRTGISTLKLVVMWSLISNFVCITLGVISIRALGSSG